MSSKEKPRLAHGIEHILGTGNPQTPDCKSRLVGYQCRQKTETVNTATKSYTFVRWNDPQ